jgi:hypothetical protein
MYVPFEKWRMHGMSLYRQAEAPASGCRLSAQTIEGIAPSKMVFIKFADVQLDTIDLSQRQKNKTECVTDNYCSTRAAKT